MENCVTHGERQPVKAEDVISKLKDDGDFDRLRVKIIRRLKENEELRSNIISMVKRSAAINRPSAENMKPRQLSDAIHAEIGDKLLSQVSEGLWNVIKSPDGMKTEITETVRSIYEKLSNPRANDNGESSSHVGPRTILGNDKRGSISTETEKSNERHGFSLTDQRHPKNSQIRRTNDFQTHGGSKKARIEENSQEPDNLELDAPPGFTSIIKPKNLHGTIDQEDPEVPPGFG